VSQEAVLEIFVSDSGTWTVVVTDPKGVSCVLAAGQSWEEIPSPATRRVPEATLSGVAGHPATRRLRGAVW
jgi:hypothetical protein